MKSAADIRAELQARVDAEGLVAVARSMGILKGNLSNFLHNRYGYHEPGPQLCASLGIRRIVAYERIDNAKQQA